ncbi:MAG: hypothetical protein NT003_00770 [Candidatus Magasanikbacteria bacterium]|nr:hypothetical protein [Candidatus Magasanikbacteria bacterium]
MDYLQGTFESWFTMFIIFIVIPLLVLTAIPFTRNAGKAGFKGLGMAIGWVLTHAVQWIVNAGSLAGRSVAWLVYSLWREWFWRYRVSEARKAHRPLPPRPTDLPEPEWIDHFPPPKKKKGHGGGGHGH